jgi:glycosyltransferase involved in cell wall biosynthesis
MNISINRTIRKGPYGGGNQILSLFSDYLTSKGHIVFDKINSNTNVIYIWESNPSSMSFSIDNIGQFLKNHKECFVIHRINDNGLHRNDAPIRDQWFKKANVLANQTVFISEWVKKYYKKLGINGIVINNGVDRSIFRPIGKIRSEKSPLRIVTHHWSDNINKGYDIYKEVDIFCQKNPDIAHFKFIGRDICLNKFSNKCEKIAQLSYKDIPPYLMSEDIYVTASLYEAGGCHLVEGMSCGLIPIVRKGGGGTECYSDGFNRTFSNAEEMLNHIVDLYNNYNLFLTMKSKVITEYKYSSDDMCRQYFNCIM